MQFTMYNASIPVFQRMLKNLAEILTKAEAQAKEAGRDPQELLDARLAPDMLPFVRQIQIASDAAKGGAARLASLDVPSFLDTEVTFAELQERVTKTLAFVSRVVPVQLEGSETRAISLKVRDKELNFTGEDYLLHFALPNFYFHLTTAYAILRSQGVTLGKMDYLGGI